MQTRPPVHRRPQPPQWFRLVLVSTHEPLHSVSAPHMLPQTPMLHTSPVAHAVPQAPQ
jgi:hypothetical protein